ncbi:MAG: FISUMP domain-containing protein, partial [Nonlabens sp.]
AVSGVSKTVTATVSTAGTYSILASANGVSFAKAGDFTTGDNIITLTGSGTPTAATTDSYAFNTSPGFNFNATAYATEASSGGSALISGFAAQSSAGNIVVNEAVSGVTQTLRASFTRAGSYRIDVPAVSGISFYGEGSFSGTSPQDVVLTASGISTVESTHSYALGTTPSYSFDRVTASAITTIASAVTDRIWMDRDLGASRQALSSTDYLAYGSLYQWGRKSDGHQLIDWSSNTSPGTVNDLPAHHASNYSEVNSDVPADGKFIIEANYPYDWRVSTSQIQEGNLWTGASGVNNPCPAGFRVPTIVEWEDETNITNSDSAFTQLKLVVAGGRNYRHAAIYNTGVYGSYWSATVTVDGYNANSRIFGSGGIISSSDYRALGSSVRCLKD